MSLSLFFCLSFSLHRVFSCWRPHRNFSPPPTDGCSASPRAQILTGDRGSHYEVLLLPAADFLLLLLLLSSSVIEHHVFSRLTPPHKPFSYTNIQFSSGKEATASLSSPSSPPSPLCKFLHFLPLPAAAAPANLGSHLHRRFHHRFQVILPASHHRHARWFASLASPSSPHSTVLNSGLWIIIHVHNSSGLYIYIYIIKKIKNLLKKLWFSKIFFQ